MVRPENPRVGSSIMRHLPRLESEPKTSAIFA